MTRIALFMSVITLCCFAGCGEVKKSAIARMEKGSSIIIPFETGTYTSPANALAMILAKEFQKKDEYYIKDGKRYAFMLTESLGGRKYRATLVEATSN